MNTGVQPAVTFQPVERSVPMYFEAHRGVQPNRSGGRVTDDRNHLPGARRFATVLTLHQQAGNAATVRALVNVHGIFNGETIGRTWPNQLA